MGKQPISRTLLAPLGSNRRSLDPYSARRGQLSIVAGGHTRCALDVKNKTGFLDGTLERPEADGEERQQWQRCNNMVKHWLFGSMSKTMHKSVARMKDAKGI
ncbi:hypothetical protein ACLB2K_018464 [Fragaria x ananassa]